MDVILHVGAHRSATTTFQRHLCANRDSLRRYHAVYWGPKVVRGGLFRTMAGGAAPILPWQANRTAKRVALRVEALRRDGVRHLILSDENMLGGLRGVLEDTRLYPECGPRLAGFAKGFEAHKVTIGLSIRCYASWWSSALAFRLLRGGPLPRRRLREYMVTQPRRWRHVIADLAAAVPNARIAVWSFEAMAGAPHDSFASLSGIATHASHLPNLNAAPRPQEVWRVLQDSGLDPAPFFGSGGHFKPFEPHEADALRAEYQDDLTWLANGAGGLADYIDARPAQTGPLTAEGRGHRDDGQHRYLA